MGFALRAPILKELGIEKDAPQVTELRKLAESYDKEVRKLMGELAAEGRTPRQEVQYKAQAKLDPELKKVLTPEQDARLRQIYWQYVGFHAFDDPELMKALDAKPDQQQKINALVVELMWKQVGILNNSPILSTEEEQKKLLGLNAEYEKKINEVLTEPQQKKLVELKGKPFNMALLLAADRRATEQTIVGIVWFRADAKPTIDHRIPPCRNRGGRGFDGSRRTGASGEDLFTSASRVEQRRHCRSQGQHR